MNEAKSTHPSQEELAAFGSGRLNVVESDEVEKHLSECATCCEVLKNLPDDDTLVSLLRPDTDISTSDDVSSTSSEHAMTLAAPVDDATAPPAVATTDVAGPAAKGESYDLPEDLLKHPRYRIVELLGRGGMGDVYRAEHKVMDRPVALKVIKPQLVQNDAAVRRFQREVRAAARLHHPNIVTAYDAEQAGNLHYLVMEYVDGVDLDEVIKQRGPIPVEEACEYIRQAAEGLQHAHELGMVHRDIKPHNLMIVRGQRSEDKDQ
jgi:predicted Ser/Thr protein kinase